VRLRNTAAQGRDGLAKRITIKRITIKDIAVRLGIAHSTVSRALSGHPHVNASVRARVLAEAAALGYVPHSGARAMRGLPNTLLGLLVPDIGNDFYASAAKAMAECVNDAGYQLVLANTGDDPDSELHHVRALAESLSAGVVVVLSRPVHRDTVALLSRVPVVQLIRRTPLLHADWMGIDDEPGLAAAVTHLADLGHRRIAYIGGELSLSTGLTRHRGFIQALQAAGLKPIPKLIAVGRPRAVFAREALCNLMQQDPLPTALVVGGARLTLGALQGVDDLGVAIPADLSIVGFGDSPWCKWYGPGLTTLSLPVRDIAFAAAGLLLRRLQESRSGIPLGQPLEVIFPATLVVRGSTSAPKSFRRS
jgi:DNA-binding LacI/PurR family transcriptional regulator